ncbi:Serine/threonine-protein kinase ATM [Camellia lanceoleosa]|uniref:Serine/threonine-protein kinase ATM n=1 Tax=Camellia lanceoleosa TaxID=1840588 RepID=A0ACC0H005_9ERIC|nr:Serine/threonine-protein kinase ATM [Camellia lanceoleosa]
MRTDNTIRNAVFCCLIHNYCSRISKHLIIYWFEGICADFERIWKSILLPMVLSASFFVPTWVCFCSFSYCSD